MISIQDDDGVRTVSLERPPANTLTVELLRALERAAREGSADPSVRALVLRSGVPKYFSAGLDGEELGPGPDGAPRTAAFQAMVDAFRAWLESPKPTVASVEGYARLGGCIIALSCDFRLAARESARFSLSEIRLGLSPTPLFLSRLLAIGVAPAATRQLALKGLTLKAEEAAAAGLVDRLVPAAELTAETCSEARSLARMPARAYAAVKRHLARASGFEVDRLWAESLSEFRGLLASAEAREALAAVGGKKKTAAGEP